MDSDRLKKTMLENAEEIGRLQSRVNEAFKLRGQSREQWAKWERACAEFHSRYDALAFPGGYSGAFDRIASGDPETIEAAICFLECRPYFFRSGYMFKNILRKCKRAPLSEEHAARLKAVSEKVAEWRQRQASLRGH